MSLKMVRVMQNCTNDDHIIVKMFKLLLKMETKDKQIKDSMIKLAKKIY